MLIQQVQPYLDYTEGAKLRYEANNNIICSDAFLLFNILRVKVCIVLQLQCICIVYYTITFAL